MVTHGGDIWEGNSITNIDLVASFFKFMYVRTWGGNTSPGKEKDALFDSHWKKLKDKVARGTYFEFQPSWSVEQNIERYKRNYPSADPGEIPDLIVYEIATTKSKSQIIDESIREYEEVKKYLGHNPWIYTGKWYWDPVFGNISLANATEMIIASYYWSDDYARSRSIKSYTDLLQFVPPGWVNPVIGANKSPIGYQWSGDQFLVPGITKYCDLIQVSLTLEQMKAMRTGSPIIIPDPVIPESIDVPAYIELNSKQHALNVAWRSQLGSGADKYHNDCGAACVSMLVSAYTQQNISVDEIYARIQPNSDTYLSVAQLKNACALYGINMIASYDLSKEYYWQSMIDKTPSIALINYKPIVDAKLADDNITFTGFHFVVVVGLDADGVLIHDPLFKTDNGAFRHIPYAVYEKAIGTSGAGILLTATKPLGSITVKKGTKYRVDVKERYIRTEPNTSTGIYVESKHLGDIVLISEISNNWGRLTDTTYWMYMPGLTKVV